MNSGKELRLSRIFGKDGKALIIPLDHGLASGPVPGFEDAEKTLKAMISAGADSILATYGMAARYPSAFRDAGLIVRLDGGPSDVAEDKENIDLMGTVEDAIRLGADAVATSTWLGGPHEARMAVQAMRLAGQCQAWGMPLMIECFMSSGYKPTVENVALAARISCELGADIVKTYLTGNAEQYKSVTSTCYRPVVILGGDKSDDELAVLKWAKTAVDGGAVGTCMGRNVWQHRNPLGVMKALTAIIHKGASVSEVAGLIG